MMRAEDIPIVYKDADFLVLDKPSGIATTAPDDAPCLFALARILDAGARQLHPLSRLDTQVTGLLVFARTERANHLALAARREGRLHRRYLGLTGAGLGTEAGEWQWAIALDPRDPRKRCALEPGQKGTGVKHAHTRFAVRAHTERVWALDLWPLTGRTHQLRVHASRAGVPLLGDVAYGGEKRVVLPNGRILSAPRVMLHCAEVRMPHPDPAVPELSLSLPAPADMAGLFRGAGGDATALDA